MDEILSAIRVLPIRDRLKLVERVLHDINESHRAGEPRRDPRAVIGSFADIADVMEQIAASALADRERSEH